MVLILRLRIRYGWNLLSWVKTNQPTLSYLFHTYSSKTNCNIFLQPMPRSSMFHVLYRLNKQAVAPMESLWPRVKSSLRFWPVKPSSRTGASLWCSDNNSRLTHEANKILCHYQLHIQGRSLHCLSLVLHQPRMKTWPLQEVILWDTNCYFYRTQHLLCHIPEFHKYYKWRRCQIKG